MRYKIRKFSLAWWIVNILKVAAVLVFLLVIGIDDILFL